MGDPVPEPTAEDLLEADRLVQARQDEAAALVEDKLGPSPAATFAAWLAAETARANRDPAM
jgi:hypothetical protein